MKSKKVTIGLIQTRVSGDVDANLRRTVKRVDQAARRGAKVICLQELFRTPYFPREARKNFRHFSETIPGASTRALAGIAKRYRTSIIVPVYERDPRGRLYNSAAVIGPEGRLLPTYRKIHIPHDPLFYEKHYFRPGDTYRVYRTPHVTFAVLICFDQWFPEAARQTVLAGADLIFYPTAIGTIRGYRSPDGDWHEAWETIQRSHAIANGVHVAAVNRVGVEGQLKFWGQSFVADAFGTVVKRASASKEETVIARVDLSHNRRIRDGWGFLRNLRPDTYRYKGVRNPQP